ncbi:hypothetical protein ACFL0Y_01010 [Patescibacteria group bacterium]
MERLRPKNIKRAATEMVIREIVNNLDHFKDLFYLDFPLERVEKVGDLVADGALVALVSNHQSHPDGLVHAWAAETLTAFTNRAILRAGDDRPLFPGFVGPMAASVASGKQGVPLELFYQFSEDWFKKRSLKYVPVSREKYTEAGEKSKVPNEQKWLTRQIKAGVGLSIFPGGTINPGRLEHEGILERLTLGNQRNGLDRIQKQTLLSQYVLFARQKKRDLVLVCLGISETSGVFSPNYRMPTLAAITNHWHNRRRNPNTTPSTHIARATMGEPFMATELQYPDYEGTKAPLKVHCAINNQLLELTSQYIPPGERGVFKTPVTGS